MFAFKVTKGSHSWSNQSIGQYFLIQAILSDFNYGLPHEMDKD